MSNSELVARAIELRKVVMEVQIHANPEPGYILAWEQAIELIKLALQQEANNIQRGE